MTVHIKINIIVIATTTNSDDFLIIKGPKKNIYLLPSALSLFDNLHHTTYSYIKNWRNSMGNNAIGHSENKVTDCVCNLDYNIVSQKTTNSPISYICNNNNFKGFNSKFITNFKNLVSLCLDAPSCKKNRNAMSNLQQKPLAIGINYLQDIFRKSHSVSSCKPVRYLTKIFFLKKNKISFILYSEY